MKKQFPLCKDLSFVPSLLTRAYNYLHYNTKLRKSLSVFVPKYYYINPLYCASFIKAAKKVKKTAWQPDVVVLEWTEMLFLYKRLKKIFPQAKFVCSEHDLAFVSIERLFEKGRFYQQSIASRFKKKELSLIQQLDAVVVHNSLDKQRLKDNGIPENSIVVISPYFGNYVKSPSHKIYTNSIIFFGAMGRDENIHAVEWFIDEVFVPFKLHEVFTFHVIGGKGEILGEKYKSISNVFFTGFIDNPDPYFEKALCMVAPIFFGAGIKVKVIEGMKACLPVLTTNAGIDGINAKDKHDFLLCKTAKQYAEALMMLHSNREMAKEIGSKAFGLVEKDFNYAQTYMCYKAKLLAICNK